MTVRELSREQMLQLKQEIIDDELYESEGRGASYGELADADGLVSDDAVYGRYGGTEFSDGDFWCSVE